ncbi:hypothetical protein ACIQNU_04115 [Streptomyces sp. NPDC091292]|uniref:hypothetical protein n=1 Tax=Streptomyces sp. NPDC091292 TaxID=3365991 RepID=UPI00382739E9
MTYFLTALLALAVGWSLGHRTARIQIIHIGGSAEQDNAAFLADERRRFDQITADLDIPGHDDPRSAA